MIQHLHARGYAPVRKLGEGGFGEVWQARDRHGSDVAVKFLTTYQGDGFRRFVREFNVLAQLQHPNIVAILAADVESAPPMIVMEYCTHGSLRDWAAQSHTWQEVAAVLLHAANGLQVLHQRGGFHRDIKPDNLLMTRAGQGNNLTVKLADFGLARDPTLSGSITRTRAGTDGYIAPEVDGGAPFTQSADIYSLGVTALELLVGMRDMSRLASCACPDPFKNLCRRMNDPDANRRPTAVEVVGILRAMLQPVHKQVQHPPPSHPQREPDLLPWLLGGAAALLLVALLKE